MRLRRTTPTLLLFVAIAGCDDGNPSIHSTPQRTLFLDDFDSVRIRTPLVETARVEPVQFPLSRLEKRTIVRDGSEYWQIRLPLRASWDESGLPRDLALMSQGTRLEIAKSNWRAIPARRGLPLDYLQSSLALETDRDTVGTQRILLEEPGEATLSAPRILENESLVIDVQPIFPLGAVVSANQEPPTIEFSLWLGEQKLATRETSHPRLQSLQFDLSTVNQPEQLTLRWQGLAPTAEGPWLHLHGLAITSNEAADYVEVPVAAPADTLQFLPEAPAVIRSLEDLNRTKTKEFERTVQLIAGTASVVSDAKDAFEVFLNGQSIATSVDREASFKVAMGGMNRLRIVAPKAEGRYWLIQPDAISTDSLTAIRGNETGTAEPQPRHITMNGESHRAILTGPGSEVVLSVDSGDQEFSCSFGLFPYTESEFGVLPIKVDLFQRVDGTETHLQEFKLQRSKDWKHCTVPLDGDESRELILRVTGSSTAKTLNRLSLLAIGEPKLRSPQSDRPPNFIVYLVDTLRADHLQCYGYSRATSPHLDQLAEDGVLFEQAYSSAPWTRPSVASLFTGLWYSFHGAGYSTGLEGTFDTLAERMRDRGFETAAFVCNGRIHAQSLNFEQGFSEFTAVGLKTGSLLATDVNRLVLPYLERNRDRPFFLYLHTVDPHAPYAPHPSVAGRFQRNYDGAMNPAYSHAEMLEKLPDLSREDLQYFIDCYDEEILFNDLAFGQLVEKLKDMGLYENTHILFVSDHGEEFQEHGGFGHCDRLWQPLLRIPMVWKPAGKFGQSRNESVPTRPAD